MQGEPLRCPAHVAAVARAKPPLFQPGVATEAPQAVVNQWEKNKILSVKSICFYPKEHLNIEDLGNFLSQIHRC